MQRTLLVMQSTIRIYVSERSDNIFIGIATGNGSIASGILTAFTATSTAKILGVKMHRM